MFFRSESMHITATVFDAKPNGDLVVDCPVCHVNLTDATPSADKPGVYACVCDECMLADPEGACVVFVGVRR